MLLEWDQGLAEGCLDFVNIWQNKALKAIVQGFQIVKAEEKRAPKTHWKTNLTKFKQWWNSVKRKVLFHQHITWSYEINPQIWKIGGERRVIVAMFKKTLHHQIKIFHLPETNFDGNFWFFFTHQNENFSFQIVTTPGSSGKVGIHIAVFIPHKTTFRYGSRTLVLVVTALSGSPKTNQINKKQTSRSRGIPPMIAKRPLSCRVQSSAANFQAKF